MSFLFVTVGTTAVRNPEVGRAPDLRDNRGLRGEVNAFLGSPDQRPGNWRALERRLVEAHLRYWQAERFDKYDPLNYGQTSAELVSTKGVLQFQSMTQSAAANVVLLASDTDEGELAARVNEAVLRELVSKGTVLRMVRVKGLESRPTNLTKRLREVIASEGWQAGMPIGFNITGGFKGVVPSVTVIAMQCGASVFYQHESDGGCVVIEYADSRETQGGFALHGQRALRRVDL